MMLNAAERWAIGVSMALTNVVLSSAGFTLQRKSRLLSQQDESKSDTESTHHRCRPMWLIGVLLYVLAAVPDVVAYAMVPQVVCTTMACFRLVLLTVLAHIFLNERVQQRELIGMLSCTVGTFLCLVYGPRPSEEDRLAEAGELYHPQVQTYLSIGLGCLLLLLVLEHSEAMGFRSLPDSVHFFILPITTGLAFGVEKVFNTEIGFVHAPQDLPWGLLDQPQWLAMAASIGALGLTDFYLNLRGAERMPVQIFVPTAFAFATSLQYFQSVVIFGELSEMDTKSAALSICGALASLAGALSIQPPKMETATGHQLIATDGDP